MLAEKELMTLVNESDTSMTRFMEVILRTAIQEKEVSEYSCGS